LAFLGKVRGQNTSMAFIVPVIGKSAALTRERAYKLDLFGKIGSLELLPKYCSPTAL
jgi:hypothetical protein